MLALIVIVSGVSLIVATKQTVFAQQTTTNFLPYVNSTLIRSSTQTTNTIRISSDYVDGLNLYPEQSGTFNQFTNYNNSTTSSSVELSYD
jgi:hypothetical protein